MERRVGHTAAGDESNASVSASACHDWHACLVIELRTLRKFTRICMFFAAFLVPFIKRVHRTRQQ
jgi:hypothetical protein